MTDGPPRTMRDAFGVWNVDPVEREAVLRDSDDQHVAVPVPEEHADLFERLADTSGTVEATLVRFGDSRTAWQVAEVHGVDEKS